MYILKSGKLVKTLKGVVCGEIQKGDSFEEYATLKKNCMRKETIKVLEDSEMIALGVEDIENVLGKSLPLIILRNSAKHAIKGVKAFDKFSQEYI
jgi:CRP-like cAMP-binding protein